MSDKPSKLHKILKELVDRTNSDSKRLRILEQRNDTLDSRMNSLEQFMSEQIRHVEKSMLQHEKMMNNWDMRVTRVEGALREVMKHVKKLATTTKIQELEQLVDIYNPISSNFTTKEEVQSMIEKKIQESGKA